MQVSVPGGTNAGWRITRPAPVPFVCCGVEHKAHWVKCPLCGNPRPN